MLQSMGFKESDTTNDGIDVRFQETVEKVDYEKCVK